MTQQPTNEDRDFWRSQGFDVPEPTTDFQRVFGGRRQTLHERRTLATITPAAEDILAERERQKTAEGVTDHMDDLYSHDQLANAAVCYAMSEKERLFGATDGVPACWPWRRMFWKPTTRRRDLVKAGALILAEIERLDRAAAISKNGDA